MTTTNPVVEWLESPEGELWSQDRHTKLTHLVDIKDDNGEYCEFVAILWFPVFGTLDATGRAWFGYHAKIF